MKKCTTIAALILVVILLVGCQTSDEPDRTQTTEYEVQDTTAVIVEETFAIKETEMDVRDTLMAGFIPLEEIPELYPTDESTISGCLVIVNGDLWANQEKMIEFAENTQKGVSAFMRISHYYDTESGFEHQIYDLYYDGSTFLLEWLDNGGRISESYQFLSHYYGARESEDVAYDEFERYVLSNDNSIPWMDMWEMKYTDYKTIYHDVEYYPEYTEIPQNLSKVTLEYNGQTCATVTEEDSLKKIYELFASAEALGFEPKTHSIGIGLNLTLTTEGGAALIIELDPIIDTCRINGDYYFYGKPDESEYIEKLWEYLGITEWPGDLSCTGK